jgi:1-acyl-sn-glycerol-3-phosphate acyltransferase
MIEQIEGAEPMASYEEELRRQTRVIQRLIRIALFGKRVVVHGSRNFVPEGPNIIVGNHIGSYKDIASLMTAAPRDIFFTANEKIFTYAEFNRLVKDYLRNTLKEFGFFVYELLPPLRIAFVNYVSTYISRVGTIPVNLEGSKRRAITRCQSYLEEGKAVVLLQGKGRIRKSDPYPYVSPFRRGPAIMCYNLWREKGLLVPVTPVAYFGTHLPFVVPARIRINVGPPMYVRDYLGGKEAEVVENFRRAMEMRVRSLFRELLRI